MAGTMLAMILLGGTLAGPLLIPLALATTGFWIWMLVDNAKRIWPSRGSGEGCALRAAGMIAVILLPLCSLGQANYTMLQGEVPPIVPSLQPMGVLSPTNTLTLTIGLRLNDSVGLSNFLAAVYDPSSSSFRKFLTPQQFTDRFGPSEQDYESVIAFAEASGLQVVATSSNRIILEVAGTVSSVQTAFGMTIRIYKDPAEARTFHAPDTEPQVPSVLPIADIAGLDSYGIAWPAGHLRPPSVPTKADGSGPGGAYMGYDFRRAYVPEVSLTGSGQTVGLLELDGYYANDIANYETQAGLPGVPLSNILLDGVTGHPSAIPNQVMEVSADIELAVAMAPGLSEVIVYEGTEFAHVLNEMAFPTRGEITPNQISCSWEWTWSPDRATIDALLQDLAAQGVAFFAASGDSEAWCGEIWAPSDDPWATVVGGTTLSMNGSGGSWSWEEVWNPGNGLGSGGGISTDFAIPSYQSKDQEYLPFVGGSVTYRNIPDVAMVADNVWVIYNDGWSNPAYGTSLGAPLWAGFAALINQRATQTGLRVGFLNPLLYSIGEGSGYSTSFHNNQTGNNNNSCNGFSTFPGYYDLCKGWGTPKGGNLISAIMPPEFTLTGPMTTARDFHTAILLQNGLVLVAAGANGSGINATAESYNPATGTWTGAGSLSVGRSSFTATLLQNGKVLVAGGQQPGGVVLADAELYDPGIGKWRPTGPMSVGRWGHTATLLPGGLVLVAGGQGSGSASLASAELYDSTTGTWTSTLNTMNAARYNHTATLLPNASVLVAGGEANLTALASAELFSTKNSSWTTAGSLNVARYGHSASLLSNGLVLVTGGASASGYLAGAELYDRSTGAWTATGSMNGSRFFHTATLLPNGQVLITGGYGGAGYLDSAELYDPAAAGWAVTASMNSPRFGHTATLLPDGQVLAAGGFSGTAILSSVELYTPY